MVQTHKLVVSRLVPCGTRCYQVANLQMRSRPCNVHETKQTAVQTAHSRSACWVQAKPAWEQLVLAALQSRRHSQPPLSRARSSSWSRQVSRSRDTSLCTCGPGAVAHTCAQMRASNWCAAAARPAHCNPDTASGVLAAGGHWRVPGGAAGSSGKIQRCAGATLCASHVGHAPQYIMF